MGGFMFLDILRGVEDLATVGTCVLLPHLVDHVPVGSQADLVPELLEADVAVLLGSPRLMTLHVSFQLGFISCLLTTHFTSVRMFSLMMLLEMFQ